VLGQKVGGIVVFSRVRVGGTNIFQLWSGLVGTPVGLGMFIIDGLQILVGGLLRLFIADKQFCMVDVKKSHITFL